MGLPKELHKLGNVHTVSLAHLLPFFNYLKNWKTKKNVLTMEWLFHFFLQLLFKTSIALINIWQDIHAGLPVKCQPLLNDFNEKWNVLKIFI
jgi:hypothetical protein